MQRPCPADVPRHLLICHADTQAENRRDKAEARGLTGGILVDLSHSSRTELRARKRITKCVQSLCFSCCCSCLLYLQRAGRCEYDRGMNLALMSMLGALRRKAQVELHRIAAREANQARSGASQINVAAGFTAADMLAAAKVRVWLAIGMLPGCTWPCIKWPRWPLVKVKHDSRMRVNECSVCFTWKRRWGGGVAKWKRRLRMRCAMS